MSSAAQLNSTVNVIGPPKDTASRQRTQLQQYGFQTLILVVSVIVIVPCFWQPRIHALDLPSHTYNAWLASVVQRDPVSGIIVDSPWTNILFDLLLAGTAKVVGFTAAETITVSIAVLIFFWSGFALVSRINGCMNWACIPLLLMLTYGVIFRLGFFNFYLATGLCASALATLRVSSYRRLAIAVVLAAASAAANPMPLAYAIGAAIYVAVLRRTQLRFQIVLLSVAAAALIAFGQALAASFPTSAWSLDRLISIAAIPTYAGMDQLWVYNDHYFLLGLATLLVVLAGTLPRLSSADVDSWRPILHLLALNVILMNALPSAILLPAHKTPLAFLTDRISLFSALLVCCLIAGLPSRHWSHRVLMMICLTFFGLTLHDDVGLTRFSVEVQRAIERVPVRSRVIASISDSKARLDPLLHVVDRACVGRCFSYGNYEPVSGHFRVKALGQNGIVLASADAVRQVEAGNFVVRASDGPVYAVCDCGDTADRLCPIQLRPGDRMCSVRLAITAK